MQPWAPLRAAIAFLTRIPVGKSPIDATASSWSPALFPLVGIGLGLLNYCAFYLAQPLGPSAAAVLSVAFSVLITGAFHEDGLADSADGLMGANARVRALEIMKDSRIGTYGASALFLILLLRVTLLAHLCRDAIVALVLSASLARLGPLWLLTHVDHAAKDQAKHKDFVSIGHSRAWLGSLVMGVVSAILVVVDPDNRLRLILSWFAAASVAIYVWRLGCRRLGGITGDLLGACEQIGEAFILAIYSARP